MEHGFLDRYSSLESPVHRADPRAKAVLALAFILVVVSTPPQHLQAFAVYGGLLLWTAALGRIPLGFALGRAALVLPFSALVAVGLPFMSGGESVELLGGRLVLSVAGLWLLAGAAMKSFLGALAAVLLVSTTPYSALLAGLRRLGAPALLIDLLALTYRYIFLLTDQAMRLKRAAAARGYRPRWLPQAVIVGRMAGSLFVRSYERAEAVYAAMLLRGYTGRMPAAAPHRFTAGDGLMLLGFIPMLAAIRIFIR
jgi:cobalt/nickel transport system permease protein